MIYLRVVRQAVCDVCGDNWELNPTGKPPVDCPFCGSQCWNQTTSKAVQAIRHGRTRKTKKLNPGAKSKKRQDQGKRQWRQFKPKPEKPDDISGKNETPLGV